MTELTPYDQMFREALRIRLVEEEIIERYPSDKIQSPVHLSIGQEAVAVGICQALQPQDLLFATYRSHGFYLAKGGSLNKMMAELYGRIDGCCQGKGGSMHMAAPEVGFMGTSAVVASSISNAVGAALAAKQLGKDHLTVSIFGDGATEEGVYHEALNFAALHQLPVIFVCENNQYAVHSKLAERQAYSICDHAKVYGYTPVHVEQGYDFMAVYEAFSTIAETAKRERTPQFIEIFTSRYMEHVGPGEDFGGGYRNREEVSTWQAMDPLIQDQASVARWQPELLSEIADSVAFAEASPFPTREDLYRDVI